VSFAAEEKTVNKKRGLTKKGAEKISTCAIGFPVCSGQV
jgi:hypothetical protein